MVLYIIEDIEKNKQENKNHLQKIVIDTWVHSCVLFFYKHVL